MLCSYTQKRKIFNNIGAMLMSKISHWKEICQRIKIYHNILFKISPPSIPFSFSWMEKRNWKSIRFYMKLCSNHQYFDIFFAYFWVRSSSIILTVRLPCLYVWMSRLHYNAITYQHINTIGKILRTNRVAAIHNPRQT